MDLPGDDPTATFDTYADVVVAALNNDGADENVVLVGHSLAGLTIPLVATRRPVGRLVYICAIVPLPGSSFIDQMTVEQDMLDRRYAEAMGEPDPEGRRAWADDTMARHFMYADCDDESAAAAVERLRPQATAPYARPYPLDTLPETPSNYILCEDDRLVNPDWSRRVARERLHADVAELPGSHSPFWSRPRELASLLDRIAS
jgi:pimeloyl-ACP methyl ester carboxylesterase